MNHNPYIKQPATQRPRQFKAQAIVNETSTQQWGNDMKSDQKVDSTGINTVRRKFEHIKQRIELGEITGTEGFAEISVLNKQLADIRKSAFLSIEKRIAERDEV